MAANNNDYGQIMDLEQEMTLVRVESGVSSFFIRKVRIVRLCFLFHGSLSMQSLVKREKNGERGRVRIREESREKFRDTSLNNWNTNKGIGVDSQPVDPRRERERPNNSTTLPKTSFRPEVLRARSNLQRAREEGSWSFIWRDSVTVSRTEARMKEISSANGDSAYEVLVARLSQKLYARSTRADFREVLHNRPSLLHYPIHSTGV